MRGAAMMGSPLAVILDHDELASIRRRSFYLGAVCGVIAGVAVFVGLLA